MKQLPFLNDAADDRTAVDSSTPAATPAAANPRRPAIIVPVQATAADEIARQCGAVADAGAVDVIEWRIDTVIAAVTSAQNTDSNAAATAESAEMEPRVLAEAVLNLAPYVTRAGLPVLMTLRTGFEGGQAEVGEDVYTEVLRAVISGLAEEAELPEPAKRSAGTTWALDVEIERNGAARLIEAAHDLGISVVASHHNFAGTDSAEAMGATFTAMAAAGADVAKIAMMPTSSADVAELLGATARAEATLDIPVLGISMGQLGRTSRIMGPDFGSCATFAQLGEPSAPGQIAVADLVGVIDELYG
ncbi:type I 3-dehydroquinate dehydratase [Brevibacterium zhoupengii]|uniref:type I 3-dehydroquinate dehydratase n=1 Tax=Brevibacterium zhoupengii TaxID=2898795 RepID=UPI001E3ECBA9|nr:type I 3-dehydroquinate dehydratase [Brevibacterium zhoupengii]